MFPQNKVNLFYRIICLISFITIIILINSIITLLVLFFAFILLAFCERSIRNMELVFITLIILGICYYFDNYIAFKVILGIDYCFYFLDYSHYVLDEEIKISEKEYIRFSKKRKKKGSNNVLAVYLTVHFVILFLAILVG